MQKPNKSLYNDIKNEIELLGGYVDVQINSTLLQIPVDGYLDLILALEGREEQKKIKKILQQEFRNSEKYIGYIENESVAKQLSKFGIQCGKEFALSLCKACGEQIPEMLKTYFAFTQYQ